MISFYSVGELHRNGPPCTSFTPVVLHLCCRQTAQNWPFVMSLIARLFKRGMFRHIFVLFQIRGRSNNTFVSRLYIFTGGCK